MIVKDLHARARGNPGVRRFHTGLAAVGHRVSRKRVWRLMRAAGLRGRHPRAWKRTTVQGERPVSAPDLISRDFTAARPNQRWCGDVTYVKTWDGWAYVATVIDLYSRAIIGYAVDDHMRTTLVTDALDMAVARRRPPAGVIFHSDRGSTYTSKEFDKYCRAHNIRRSLGRTGICYDNAVSESTFATYKKELIHTRPWPGPKNPENRHRRLDRQLLQHHPQALRTAVAPDAVRTRLMNTTLRASCWPPSSPPGTSTSASAACAPPPEPWWWRASP
jgi:transposase InsO family protein